MSTTVGVEGLTLSAHIGVHHHEQGRRQPLIVAVELTLAHECAVEALAQTVDYRDIVAEAQALADRHIDLIETYAHRLAERCLALGPVARAQIQVDKPEALADALASVRVTRIAG